MTNLIWVFIGGGLGSLFRYQLSIWLKPSAAGFPWGTLAANFISCIVLGFLINYNLKNGINSNYRLLLMTGFCGGFSTFSTYSAEIFSLFQAGKINLGLSYMGISLIVGLIGVGLGMKLNF